MIHNKKRFSEILLAVLIMARATGYLFSKVCLREMGVFTLLAERFLLAGLVLFLLFGKRIFSFDAQRQNNTPAHRPPRILATVWRGALLGLVYFLCMSCELTSLKTTDTSTVSLLENTAIILVPLLEIPLLKKLPRGITLLCAVIALCGVFSLTYTGAAIHLSSGELFSVGAALFSACGIILTGKFSRTDDGLSLGIFEVFFLGVYALISSLLLETPVLPQTGHSWGALIYLAFVCTGFGYTLQPVAQRNIDADKTSVFYAINPAFAAFIGIAVLKEPLNPHRVIGIALILAALLLSTILDRDTNCSQNPQTKHPRQSCGTRLKC